MDTKTGERWHCMNPGCRKEVLIQQDSGSTKRPVCSCGSSMKKDYNPPVFRYLEFLTLDAQQCVSGVAREK